MTAPRCELEVLPAAPRVAASPSARRAHSRWDALRCALQGLHGAWHGQPNLRLHVYVAAAVLLCGVWCRLAPMEWLWVSFAISLVLVTELFNTAIEHTVDLVVGPALNPLARQAKDIAAGCVLIAAVTAVVIGVFTFFPHLHLLGA